jgi:hypothetical protein
MHDADLAGILTTPAGVPPDGQFFIAGSVEFHLTGAYPDCYDLSANKLAI